MKTLSLRDLNSELAAIKEILRIANRLHRYKNEPFQRYRVFWEATRNARSQEEFTKEMERGVREGVVAAQRMICKLAKKLEATSHGC